MKHSFGNTTGRREIRAPWLVAGSATLAVGVALMLSPVGAGAQADPVEPTSNIAVVQTPSGSDEACQPALTALSNTVHNNPESFVLTVTASAPLCDPIDATAVIYAMPGNGVAWPQELVETADFTISEAGVTEITFTKTCDPVQFDVVTGPTPEVISPLGDKHGPLLFPLDTGTSLQFWGLEEGCVDSVTTIAPTSTTSTTTTTEKPSVLVETTIAQPTTTVPVSVLAATTIPGTGSELAVTGSSTTSGLGLLGAGMALAGVALILFSRRTV